MALTAEFLRSTHLQSQTEDVKRENISTPRAPAYLSLENVLAKFQPLPENGLFLGVASDGLPVLLNLKDPRPGALLLLGDLQSGKTDFLQVVARAAALSHLPSSCRFVVVTSNLREWEGWKDLPHCLGIWTADNPGLQELLLDLSARAQQPGNAENVVLLVDDLQSLIDLDKAIQEGFFWLLANGAVGRVWIIATLKADLAPNFPLWVRAFGTRIFGRIGNPELADRLTPMPGANLRTLLSGAQFCIRERNHWLRFWLPLLK
jgi:hypothetical protein